MLTEKDKQMVSTVLSNSAKENGMTVQELVDLVLPAFQKSYDSSEQADRDFWAGFKPEGDALTIDEAVVWLKKKLMDSMSANSSDHSDIVVIQSFLSYFNLPQ